MLEITSLKNGIVIDHVKAGNGIKIFELLGLADLDDQVALILNAESSNMGRKDIIKVENHQDIDLDIVSIIDSEATVNIIENEEVVEKKELELPEEIENILTCQNPKCISTSERSVTSKFILINPEETKYKCAYCDHIYDVEE
ncbi:aspartate carbamoyltransferase regulatory subunit [Anaerococcus sp. mt242]|uniref:aspartate carbamoyltransferase regulatory subunit n=1 Tax=unclassified Anaerococcus TaxID=2614126 RepID=UPI0019344950|nr:aspartate carbamoyltransferase regulatory subunit [Anaerococcus sp. mt242]MBM0046791.1 aspartate carbamoyltransferase regulatory subunit [Anaerococcus sp. mt242]